MRIYAHTINVNLVGGHLRINLNVNALFTLVECTVYSLGNDKQRVLFCRDRVTRDSSRGQSWRISLSEVRRLLLEKKPGVTMKAPSAMARTLGS